MYKPVCGDQASLIRVISDAGLNRRVVPGTVRRKKAEKHQGTQAMLYAEGVTKRNPDNEVMVVVACSSWETYGPNSNGDGFPSEKAYPEYGIEEKDLLRNNYKSFEKGQVYYMHDMNQPVGWVLKAFWNDRYKWVEIVLELDSERINPDVLKRVREGEMIFVSMGCNVEYDVCTVCGHKSRGRNYCSHIKNRLLEVIDDVIAAMLNPSPDFDDISVVFIPAEAIAASIYRKAAGSEQAMFVPGMKAKRAELAAKVKKIADIYKNTAILRSVKEFKDAYKPLVGKMESGLGKGEITDVLTFFYRTRIPMPVEEVGRKFGVVMSDIVDQQARISAMMSRDDKVKTFFENAGTPESFGAGLAELADTFRPEDDRHTEAALIAIFNIVNKLLLMNDGVDSSALPSDSPGVTELERIIELEYLAGE